MDTIAGCCKRDPALSLWDRFSVSASLASSQADNNCNSCFSSFYCLHLLNIVRLHSQKHYRSHNSNAFHSQ